MQQFSQVGARLTFQGIRPELERELRAVLRVPAQRDQSKKPLQAQGLESAQALAVKDHFDDSKKPDR